MKKRNGFTLVELLAVIAILAILVIIALPNVLRMFRTAKENTFVEETQKIVQTAETEFMNENIANDDCKCFSSGSNPLKLTGRSNIKYYVEFNNEGKISKLVVADDSYQIVIDGKVTIDDIGNSTSDKTNKSEALKSDTEVPTCNGKKPATPTVSYNQNLSSDNDCLKSTDICPSGTEVNVQVNDSKNYKFYVINDDGNKLTLIMSQNIGKAVAWNDEAKINKGPLTALEELENNTNDWTNIPDMSYSLKSQKYGTIEKSKVKARLLTYEEAENLGCVYDEEKCPLYLSEHSEYWLSSTLGNYSTYIDTPDRELSSNPFYYTNCIGGSGGTKCEQAIYKYYVRPVIEINKSL